MRTRLTLFPLLVTALCAPAAAHASTPAAVHLSHCRTGQDSGQRQATFRGQMRDVTGSVRMAMRFELLERYPGHTAHTVPIPKLGRWHRSHPGVLRYTYTQKVKQLKPGGSYRTRVSFRWYGANGELLKRARRVSKPCVQDRGLPNLVVSAVRILPGDASGTAQYSVTIDNTGEGPAEGFQVTLIIDGAVADERKVDRLDAGESDTVDLNGPDCKRLRAVVDRYEDVPEEREDDNSLRSRCP
jgi:hypothetical protein